MKTRVGRVVLGLMGFAAACVAALLPLLAESGQPRERELVLVAREMAFYEDGSGPPNPTIRLFLGERLRVTLVNDDPGVDHDFALPAWSMATPVLRGPSKATMIVQAPETPGRTEYVCSLHGSMMTGVLEVIASGAASKR